MSVSQGREHDDGLLLVVDFDTETTECLQIPLQGISELFDGLRQLGCQAPSFSWEWLEDLEPRMRCLVGQLTVATLVVCDGPSGERVAYISAPGSMVLRVELGDGDQMRTHGETAPLFRSVASARVVELPLDAVELAAQVAVYRWPGVHFLATWLFCSPDGARRRREGGSPPTLTRGQAVLTA